MAEVIGVVASGISIGLLAIQLFESVLKNYRFWKLINKAPKDIENLIEELHVLGSVLSDLVKQTKITENLPSGTLQIYLKYYCKIINDFRTYYSTAL